MLSADEAPSQKRRKVRKGTQSCWECKRRKARCVFTASTDTICEGCKRRGATCISQEFLDPPGPTDSSRHIGDRLSRVEDLLEQLIKTSGGRDAPENLHASANTSHDARGSLAEEPATRNLRQLMPKTPDSRVPGDKAAISPEEENTAKPKGSPEKSSVTISSLRSKGQISTSERLVQALHSAWPCPRYLESILNVPVGISGLAHGLICTPPSIILGQDAPSPREILQLPPIPSQPVFIASKLLLLGTFLQAIPPSSIRDLSDQGIDCKDVMTHVIETSHSLVTSNDELISSVEGIECIMIESMFHNNAGNLRRAWLTMRRAMLTAQLMGLHRGANSTSLKYIDSGNRTRLNPEHMWFRLVQSDRYLSSMLGLPQGSLDNSFATPKALEGRSSVERMQRLECMAGGRILQRNQTNVNDLASTYEIDQLLQKASACRPGQWWLLPNVTSSEINSDNQPREMLRVVDQLTHYHLLAQLHLPFLLCDPNEHQYDYSKVTAVNASREVLTRFIYFRGLNRSRSYCRGIDFLGFMASTTLCLAHINASHVHQAGPSLHEGRNGNIFSLIAHQRLSDRGLVELTLDSLEALVRESNDSIASKIISILRHLLVIETDAAEGSYYDTNSSSQNAESDLECGGKISDGGNVLHIHIPHFGGIKIERTGIWRPLTAVPPSQEANNLPERESHTARMEPGISPGRLTGSELDYDQEQQGPAPTNIPAEDGIDSGLIDMDFSGVPSAGTDDWILQGVDTAFFNSLFQGASLPESAEDDNWL